MFLWGVERASVADFLLVLTRSVRTSWRRPFLGGGCITPWSGEVVRAQVTPFGACCLFLKITYDKVAGTKPPFKTSYHK